MLSPSFIVQAGLLLAAVTTVVSSAANQSAAIDSAIFASAAEIKHLVNQVCKDGLRLPGSAVHRAWLISSPANFRAFLD